MHSLCAAATVATLLLLLSPASAVTPSPQSCHAPTHGATCHSRDHCVARTPSGDIIGHPAPERPAVEEYLGIPFAQPPLGDLRFAAPQPLTKKSRLPFNAAQFGFDCPSVPSPFPPEFPGLTPQARRIFEYFAGSNATKKSEDCLTLNVWTKPCHAGSPAKPVLVFFYGGRFTSGNTNTPFYNGQFLADAEDIIVVTLNYRVDIFGFPGAPGADTNLGLRDQRLAVEWIRDNIAAFGGDPSKITIWGQSSGGVAVDYWSYAYQHDPIVHALISDSGTAYSFPLNTAEVTVHNWYNVSAAVGCGSSGDTLPCMRQKPFQQILIAQSKIRPAPGGSPYRSIPPFYPEIDNETVFGNYLERSTNGQFARIPYLAGNNNHEQGFYALAAFARNITPTAEQSTNFLLSSFTCAVSQSAQGRVDNGVPMYVYRYFGNWSNIELYPTSGAYHGTELEMVFGNPSGVSGIPNSEPEIQTIALMQRAWAAFAQDPKHGLQQKLGWPRYDPDEDTLIQLALGNQPRATFVDPHLYNSPCPTVGLGAP